MTKSKVKANKYLLFKISDTKMERQERDEVKFYSNVYLTKGLYLKCVDNSLNSAIG